MLDSGMDTASPSSPGQALSSRADGSSREIFVLEESQHPQRDSATRTKALDSPQRAPTGTLAQWRQRPRTCVPAGLSSLPSFLPVSRSVV